MNTTYIIPSDALLDKYAQALEADRILEKIKVALETNNYELLVELLADENI